MKKAIALIELIFAMVIIAISLISVPNLISKTSSASNNAIEQEAVSNAASYIDMIMSNFWDEECVDPKRANPILTVDKEDSALKEQNVTLVSGLFVKLGKRVGAPNSSSRHFGFDINGTRYKATKADKLGFEPLETEPNDIDDFNNRQIMLSKVEQTTATEGDYKDKSVKLSTSVKYIQDLSNPVNYKNSTINFNNPFSKIENKSTNIKSITVTLTSTNDNKKTIKLSAFSCNIGSAKLKEKKF